MIDPALKGKVAIVTGANHGIGAATAKALAAQGAAVLITYKRLPLDQPVAPDGPGEALYQASRARPADGVVAAIRAGGGQAEAWEADLADPANLPALFDRAEAAFGPVAVLINNAAYWEADTFLPPHEKLANEETGLWMSDPIPSITGGSHDRHFEVNARATALLMAEFGRRHVARGADWGRIVNVSTDGAHCFPSEVSYGASKYAMESYTRSAAVEFARYGITINVVSLGPIQTGWISPELEAAILPGIPAGRLGQPEDVADAILLLCSEQARWITGQVIYVGGGNKV